MDYRKLIGLKNSEINNLKSEIESLESELEELESELEELKTEFQNLNSYKINQTFEHHIRLFECEIELYSDNDIQKFLTKSAEYCFKIQDFGTYDEINNFLNNYDNRDLNKFVRDLVYSYN